MRNVKVKICGITSVEDAQAAMDMGTDILGFNFFPESPRYVTVDQAARIATKLPAFIALAGVFVNSTREAIHEAMEACFLDWIQLHGDETPEFCQSFCKEAVKVMKAIRVKESADIAGANAFPVHAILLDAFHPDRYGGTGDTFDWGLIAHTGKRVFLAGGINPDNVVEALELDMYGIDVCSGIESEPGKKDHEKMQALFNNIRHLRG